MNSDLFISKIGPESDAVLRNLLEHYIYDMSEWFEIDTYDTAPIWSGSYDVYLAKVGDSIAGFAIAGSADEWIGDSGVNDVHEFFVMRKFRRSGLGQRIATLLWSERPGEWLVRVLEANTPAVLFWRNAITSHSHGVYEEEERIVKRRPWRFFRFVSNGT